MICKIIFIVSDHDYTPFADSNLKSVSSSPVFQARLRLADVVEKEDVNEAMRLMEMSKDSLNPGAEQHRYALSVKLEIRLLFLEQHTIKIGEAKKYL